VSINDDDDLQGCSASGASSRSAIDEMRGRVEPGVTTANLDAVCGDVLAGHGARSAPHLVYGFPGVACISVNDEAAHGVPGRRVIAEGDFGEARRHG
jgi:methionyl aminopeptidase